MAKTHIEWVTALPVERTPSTIYFLRSDQSDIAEIYLTNNEGTELRHLLHAGDVVSMISESLGNMANIEVVNTITDRDALNLTKNTQILVLDATGDDTVELGAATYVYRAGIGDFIKVNEFESLDVTPHWDNLVGRPASTAAQIDDAVLKSHLHLNLAILDGLSGDDESVSYRGKPIVTADAEPGW